MSSLHLQSCHEKNTLHEKNTWFMRAEKKLQEWRMKERWSNEGDGGKSTKKINYIQKSLISTNTLGTILI